MVALANVMKNFHETASSSLGFKKDSFIYSIVPSSRDNSAGTLEYAAIASDDSLAFFTVASNTITVGKHIENAHQGVACLDLLSSGPGSTTAFATAGRDGRVKCWSNHGNSQPWREFRTR